ncbi:hypothetical protein, partial [Senegalimassilia anaerobia]|uniref:hypothetical protein n=1 Tax=Senegalimassilia anaerobia TaxID=1473216 RepID=UPI00265FF6F7
MTISTWPSPAVPGIALAAVVASASAHADALFAAPSVAEGAGVPVAASPERAAWCLLSASFAFAAVSSRGSLACPPSAPFTLDRFATWVFAVTNPRLTLLGDGTSPSAPVSAASKSGS